MNFEKLLNQMVELKASDLFITSGLPPCVKANGKVDYLSDTKLSPERSHEIVMSLMDDEQQEEFLKERELNFAIQVEGLGRFRVNAFQQRSCSGAVLRRIETVIPKFEDLGVPQLLADLAMTKRGLIILVGATGAGKSSTLAAMIGHRNQNSSGHIITIEDPIEFIHEHAGCILTQREVGVDTDTFEIALKNTLRQAPDVILLGEIRSQDTMNYAMKFAETGHLCFATLHANNANQALDRIVNFFPPEAHKQLWSDLSMNLKAIVAQQLIPTVDEKGRVPAIEILLNNPAVANNIAKGEVGVLKELMNKGRDQGMQSFDFALYQLYAAGKISYENALKHADSENEIRLMIKLNKKQLPQTPDKPSGDGTSGKGKADFSSGLSLQSE